MHKTKKRSRGNGDGSLTQDPKSGVWIAWYHDADGKRRKRSTRRTFRRDAEELLAKWMRDEANVRDGLVDPDAIQRRDQRVRPLADHVREYFDSWRLKGRTTGSVGVRKSQLATLLRVFRAILKREPRLADFTPDLLARAMRAEVDAGRSLATANNLRALAVAFAAWLTREGRADLASFGARVDRFDSDLDRRRERRALTDGELVRLFDVARERGRFLWYALAYYAGLRRGELGRVTWGDVDLDRHVLRVRNTKAARLDELPLHDALVDELCASKPLLTPSALNSRRIFPHPVSRRTRLKDYARAGIADRDDRGRVADLHALRATVCTALLDRGVPATKVQRMMRHRELSTTLRHYHKLELSSIAEGLSVLPVVARADVLAATGTDCESGSSSGSSRREKRLETAKHGATASTHEATCATPETPTALEVTRSDATGRDNVISFPIPRALSSVD
jgi:integrase